MSFSASAKWRISILTSKDVLPERSARFLSSSSTCWKRLSSRNGAEFNFETCSKGGFEFFRILATVGSIFIKQLTSGLILVTPFRIAHLFTIWCEYDRRFNHKKYRVEFTKLDCFRLSKKNRQQGKVIQNSFPGFEAGHEFCVFVLFPTPREE